MILFVKRFYIFSKNFYIFFLGLFLADIIYISNIAVFARLALVDVCLLPSLSAPPADCRMPTVGGRGYEGF